ncbi:MAG: 3'-phosphoesterase [Candidatus Altiarchaeales archaeon]|nr:MAG: 3'-phosphoesterase [Candidatus Altiarchaeales archaeon]
MPLEEYHGKRDFSKTSEPRGEVKESKGKRIFVIQKHYARKLHYDLRLEYEGVLKSWAIPKEPPLKEGIKRLAVQTEDHPLEYATFEGIIPEGLYGAGKVEIWDNGFVEIEKWSEKEITFELNGGKMNGIYVMIKMKPTEKFPGRNNWLLFKKKGSG